LGSTELDTTATSFPKFPYTCLLRIFELPVIIGSENGAPLIPSEGIRTGLEGPAEIRLAGILSQRDFGDLLRIGDVPADRFIDPKSNIDADSHRDMWCRGVETLRRGARLLCVHEAIPFRALSLMILMRIRSPPASAIREFMNVLSASLIACS
jgi:hypothetical protein